MTDDARPTAPPMTRPAHGNLVDLVAAACLAVLAALLAFTMPAGSALRAFLALPILLVVPGYLLIEAAVSSVKPGQRGLHALVAIGVSPPFVGLLALLTAVFGAFHTGPIILTVTAACLGLAFVAAWRRLRTPAAAPLSTASA
ncbi:MAG TPA: DUF1616 domain-containing protein [Candidatus Thermoplasmatota archaeon]|nr:DUF1616 domain-containing protein [Candidatus Thermoplasmatota archaeon]